MATLAFNEFLEDILDQHIALMSQQDIAEARALYASMCEKKKPSATHPEMKLSVADLRAQCERLTNGQRKAVAKYEQMEGYDMALRAMREAVSLGDRLLTEKRPTKADFIQHKEMNQAASRILNNTNRAAIAA